VWQIFFKNRIIAQLENSQKMGIIISRILEMREKDETR
jgi:hypothetical protein